MSDSQQGGRYDRCGARLHKGRPGTCKLPAGWGTDHDGYGQCRKHMGNAPNNKASAHEQQAKAAAVKFGLPIRTTGTAALQDELDRLNGLVAYYLARASGLDEADLIWGNTKRTVKPGVAPGQQGGAQQGQPQMEVILEAKPHVWLVLLEQAGRQRAAVAAKMVEHGIERRAVAATEMQMSLLKRVLDWMLGEMSEADRARVLPLLPGKLRELDAA